MLRLILPAAFLVLAAVPAAAQRPSAQGQGFWWDFSPSPQRESGSRPSARKPKSGYRQGYGSSYSDDDDEFWGSPKSGGQKILGPKVLEGGPRPDISPISPKRVANATGQDAGTVVIDTKGRQLFLVTSKDAALRYPISVGRQGFTWTGVEKVARIADWPDWHPPVEMRERDPKLPEKMLGGMRNPLGAKSLYLGNSLYRIHGTNDARTIGLAASSGCFRMMNGHVVDLAGRVGVGTRVVVLSYLGAPVVNSAAPGAPTKAQQKPKV